MSSRSVSGERIGSERNKHLAVLQTTPYPPSSNGADGCTGLLPLTAHRSPLTTTDGLRA